MNVDQLERTLLSVKLEPLALGVHQVVSYPERFVIMNLEAMRTSRKNSLTYAKSQRDLILYLKELKWQQTISRAKENPAFNAKRMKGSVVKLLFIMQDEKWHSKSELTAKLGVLEGTLSTIICRLEKNPEYGDHHIERKFGCKQLSYRMIIDPWVLKWMYG